MGSFQRADSSFDREIDGWENRPSVGYLMMWDLLTVEDVSRDSEGEPTTTAYTADRDPYYRFIPHREQNRRVGRLNFRRSSVLVPVWMFLQYLVPKAVAIS